jgi:DHA3 family tetracycline resistance protein-like MFS transporter
VPSTSRARRPSPVADADADAHAVAAATRAWSVYRAGFGFGLYLTVSVWTLSLIDRAGAGPLALVLTGTVLEVCYTLAEVPTGVIADRHGRKRSILIGLALLGCSALFDAAGVLWAVLVGQVLIGVGWTFTSGADVAWLTDEVGEEAARPLYAAGARAELWGSVAGLTLGATLGLVNLWLPLVAGSVVMFALTAWLARHMHESDRQVALDERFTVVETFRRARTSVRARPAVGLLLLVMVAIGMGGEGVDRLWQLHLVGEEAGERRTVLVVGALFLGGLILGALVTTAFERHLGADADGRWAGRALAATNVVVAGAVLLLAVGPWALAAGGLVVGNAMRLAAFPLVQSIANRDADPASRATVNSLVTQAESVGEIGGGGFGFVAAARGTTPSLVVSAALFLVGGALPSLRGRMRR